MARIYVENLPEEYRRKLCTRELTRETIAGLAASVCDKYLIRKRTFKKLVILLPAMTALMGILSFFAPAARKGNMNVIMGSFVFTLLVEILILIIVYFLAVTRVPRQFAGCLKKGYPELVAEYGYEQIRSGSLANGDGTRQASFSMQIEDVFGLKGSEDVVVVGFAHGLIARGNYVRVYDDDCDTAGRAPAFVSAIEKAGGKPAAQAADCKAALKIKKGSRLGLAPGMYLRCK